MEYYTDGTAISEEDDSIIEALEDLIGPDIMAKRPRINEDGTLFVRNDSRASDYGIIFMGKPYIPEEGPN